MQDMKGALPAGNVNVGIVDVHNYDLSDGKVWTPENVRGLDSE